MVPGPKKCLLRGSEEYRELRILCQRLPGLFSLSLVGKRSRGAQASSLGVFRGGGLWNTCCSPRRFGGFASRSADVRKNVSGDFLDGPPDQRWSCRTNGGVSAVGSMAVAAAGQAFVVTTVPSAGDAGLLGPASPGVVESPGMLALNDMNFFLKIAGANGSPK